MSAKIVAELTPEQRLALEDIVLDWISEGFKTPPYTEAQYDIFEWLGIARENSPWYDTRRPS